MNFGMIFHGMLYLSLYEELFSNLHYWNSNLFQIKSRYWIAIREKLFLSPKIKSSYFTRVRDKKVRKKLVITPEFCIFIVDNQKYYKTSKR